MTARILLDRMPAIDVERGVTRRAIYAQVHAAANPEPRRVLRDRGSLLPVRHARAGRESGFLYRSNVSRHPVLNVHVDLRIKGGRRVIRATRPHLSGKPSPRTGMESLQLNGSQDLRISGARNDGQE